ncbi:MAG TPA: hypothetical protein VME18_11280 [Acidobacteriaceae bacterium]|nr:hypothetical protein [Acidobacteriaceae bacterium]
MSIPVRVEYASQLKMRSRNTRLYRSAHWPIWIWVFFLAPGPLTFSLFDRGGSVANLVWLGAVLVGTGNALVFGKLPGSEPAPYILHFTEDRPNPLYRRICYTFAWNALLNFALLNLAGLIGAVATGRWQLRQIYQHGYFPLMIAILLLGLSGVLPRVRRSTEGEGRERRYFYGAVWSVTAAQSLLLILWKFLPRGHVNDVIKLVAWCAVLLVMGTLAAFGVLPRTRPILPGELMVAD